MSTYPTGPCNLSTASLSTQMMEPISGVALQPILPLNTTIDPKLLSNQATKLLSSAALRPEPSDLPQIGNLPPPAASFGAAIPDLSLALVKPADATRQPIPPTITTNSPLGPFQQPPKAAAEGAMRSSTLTASAAHARRKRSRSSAQLHPYIDPNWPSAILKTTFFTTCPLHSDKTRGQFNHFCLGCGPTDPAGTQLCPYCAIDHKEHCNGKCIPIFRFMYNDVIRISDLSGVLDVSGIQQVKSNNNLSVHVRSRGGINSKSGKYDKDCKGGCGRFMIDQWEFCSIACKLGVQEQAEGVGSLPMSGRGVTLQNSEADAAAMAAKSAALAVIRDRERNSRVPAMFAAGEVQASSGGGAAETRGKRFAAGSRGGKGVEEAAKGAKRRKSNPRKSPPI